MELYEIKEYVKKNRIESIYNGSMNTHGINSVKNMFSSSQSISDFLISVNFLHNGDMTTELKKLSYEDYYKFLSERSYGYSDFKDYLSHIAADWILSDYNINKNDAVIYLLNVFVVGQIDGKIKEIKTELSIKSAFIGYKVENPTPEQDLNECWDLKVSGEEICFYLQVKSKYFFHGLGKRTKYSFLKIKKASKTYSLPIYFVLVDGDNISVCTISKDNKNKTEFVSLKEMAFKTLNQDKIISLSKDIFNTLMHENNIKR